MRPSSKRSWPCWVRGGHDEGMGATGHSFASAKLSAFQVGLSIRASPPHSVWCGLREGAALVLGLVPS